MLHVHAAGQSLNGAWADQLQAAVLGDKRDAALERVRSATVLRHWHT